jgi:hypothetical protein
MTFEFDSKPYGPKYKAGDTVGCGVMGRKPFWYVERREEGGGGTKEAEGVEGVEEEGGRGRRKNGRKGE